MYGSGFDAGGGSNREDDRSGNDEGGGGVGVGDDRPGNDRPGNDRPGNGAGCAVGTVWVAATYSSPGRVDCVAPDLAPGATKSLRVAYRDARDPAGVGVEWLAVESPGGGEFGASLSGALSGATGANGAFFVSVPSTAATRGGGAAADFFGAPPDEAFGVCRRSRRRSRGIRRLTAARVRARV